jgi:hypothetical protein
MIFHPKIGQQVVCNYKNKAMPCQGMKGVVVCVGIGPGPINVGIEVETWPESGHFFRECIPRGNLNIED